MVRFRWRRQPPRRLHRGRGPWLERFCARVDCERHSRVARPLVVVELSGADREDTVAAVRAARGLLREHRTDGDGGAELRRGAHGHQWVNR